MINFWMSKRNDGTLIIRINPEDYMAENIHKRLQQIITAIQESQRAFGPESVESTKSPESIGKDIERLFQHVHETLQNTRRMPNVQARAQTTKTETFDQRLTEYDRKFLRSFGIKL